MYMEEYGVDVLTHDTEDRQNKVCQCFNCKDVERCTPRDDFYTVAGDEGPEAPLYCSGCFWGAADRRRKGLTNIHGEKVNVNL